jgi:hypothetical protein
VQVARLRDRLALEAARRPWVYDAAEADDHDNDDEAGAAQNPFHDEVNEEQPPRPAAPPLRVSFAAAANAAAVVSARRPLPLRFTTFSTLVRARVDGFLLLFFFSFFFPVD